MKNIIFILISLLLFCLYSCGYDNYDEPKAVLEGKITYKGEAIKVRGSGEKVQILLFQDGYALQNSIPVYVSQDGTFKATLFNGEYKMVTRDNNGPWVNNRDTLIVKVKGHTQCEYEVTPYYLIRGESFSVSGNQLTATCRIDEITAGRNISNVYLYINRTAFVDESSIGSVARVAISNPSDLENIKLEMDLSDRTESNLYARIGVQINGVGDYLFSDIEKIR